MGTLQNLSPNPYPNRNILPHSNPTPSPSPNPNPAPGSKSPSFEEVSKFFSRPLSDAADSLGTCPSVLKKVCYDNGLVRWPYRKFLAGKSIEEIKKDAALEKEKQLAGLKVVGQRNVSLAVSPSIGPQVRSSTTGSLQGSPTLRSLTPPPTINNRSGSSHINSPAANNTNSPLLDEFKYGFPSDGLSSISYKWWGNKSADENAVDIEKGSSKDATDKSAQQPNKDSENNTNSANLASTEWASSLTALRSKAAKEGQRALKLGVYRGYSAKTLDRAKKHALLQVFKSSLPGEWGEMSVDI
ncbi:plant regulator RWP-RK family protein [Striga asiatica]|uniref:Plant regulator RWP-RK family protein n=1 Tax=Striga asiatica TaxID=4170 RepID=A0A5A7R9X7_STRAF|nr:plant regulator RWP-RK family protein [Striga asiatica]